MKWTGTRPTSSYSGGAQIGAFVVTLAQMWSQLRITTSDEDSYICDLIDAATEAAEELLSCSLLTRTITATYYENQPWNSMVYEANLGRLYLPRGPIQSITSIIDAKSVNVTAYQLGGSGVADWVQIQQQYTAPITVTFVAGYGADLTTVPADIKMAIRTHVASLWRVRESVSEDHLVPVPHSLESFYARKSRSVPAG